LNTYVSELPIGEILVKAGLVSQVQVDEAVKDAGTRQRLIGKTLVSRGWLKPEQLRAALQAQSLLRDGLVDSFKALKALGIACNFDKSFEEALAEVLPGSVAGGNFETTCKLGELLVCAGILDTATMEQAHVRSLERGEPLGVVLVAEGLLTESYLDAALELQVRVRDGMFSREQAIAALKQDPRRLLDMIAPNMKADEGLKLKTKAAIRLGELLMRAGIVSQADVMQALELSLAHGHPIGEMLVARGFVTRALLDAALSLQRMITLTHLSIGDATACLVKVFNTDKAVSECLLELKFLKFQPPTEAVGGKVRPGRKPTQSQPDNRSTMAELPALNFHKSLEPVSAPEHAAKAAGEIPQKISPQSSPETAAQSSPRSLPAAEAETASAHGLSDAAIDIKEISIAEVETPLQAGAQSFLDSNDINYEDYFAANFRYVKADRIVFYENLRSTYSRLGRVLMKRKELNESEDLLKEAADISDVQNIESKKPEDLMFLACLYLKQGKVVEALSYFA